MPLSSEGIAHARRATEALGLEFAAAELVELEAKAEGIVPRGGGATADRMPNAETVAAEMIRAGASLHSPSLLVYSSGNLSGGAILGFKRADAYRTIVEEPLRSALAPPAPSSGRVIISDSLLWTRDYPVEGHPGAYFRSVPGRRTIAYGASGGVYLLDLVDGSSARAPGEIDFVPTPDGLLFVTPARGRSGLEFYDAEEVFAGTRRGAGQQVEPLFIDRQMRDQYPSVGLLERRGSGDGGTTIYRVLTSWFTRIAYRDYEVRRKPGGRLTVRAIAGRVTACPQLSIPIISPDGRLVAAREESIASTRIYRLGEEAECEAVVDLGVQTGKVSWSPDGARIAFAIPRGAARHPVDGGGSAVIFVYDLERRALHRVPGSEDANRLAFPEFVGADSLAYLVQPEQGPEPNVIRMACCLTADRGEPRFPD